MVSHQSERSLEGIFEVKFEDSDRDFANLRTYGIHGRVPNIVVPRGRKEVVAVPSDAKETVLVAMSGNASAINWDRHFGQTCSTIGDMAAKKASFDEHAQVLTDGIVLCGWIFEGSITLVKEEQITDQVQIAFHGFRVVQVVRRGEQVSRIRFARM